MISGILEAGCDEAGRGPLAGSVFAAAVILPSTFDLQPLAALNDSKQLTDLQRRELRPVIQDVALAWAVAEVTAEEIDRLNILNASILAMHRALDLIINPPLNRGGAHRAEGSVLPQHILVDGNRWKPYVPEGELLAIPATTVVKGDATYMSIAAASVLAKTYRDDYMLRLHAEFPQYGWDHNMGYPTEEHYAAIRKHGLTPYHRKTFNLHLA